MKKARLIASMIVLLTLCTTAVVFAEAYTNPVYDYSIEVPDGWFVIDGGKVQTLRLYGMDVYENRNMVIVDITGQFHQDSSVIMLYENGSFDRPSANCMNISTSVLEQIITIDQIINVQDAFVDFLKVNYPGYQLCMPVQVETFHEYDCIVTEGIYPSGEYPILLLQVHLPKDNTYYTLSLFCDYREEETYKPFFLTCSILLCCHKPFPTLFCEGSVDKIIHAG